MFLPVQILLSSLTGKFWTAEKNFVDKNFKICFVKNFSVIKKYSAEKKISSQKK